MNKWIIGFAFSLLGLLLGTACGPKVIEGETIAAEAPVASTGIFDSPTKTTPPAPSAIPSPAAATPSGGDVKDNVHKVVVVEVLPTQRYVYLKVNEGVQEYWVAARKQPIEVGETYYFTNALLKTDFVSQEYNRTFDQIYLVSKLVSEHHAGGNLPSDVVQIPMHGPDKATTPSPKAVQSAKPGGTTSILDLTTNPQSYAGKSIILHGKVTKVNPRIMSRNWIHLQDGSADDVDLVITSQADVTEGSVISIKGTVVLNKDFGAGYSYALLVEEGELLK